MKKPNDGFTRVILGFNISNADGGVKSIIEDWKYEINLPRDAIGGVAYETEEEMVQGLYQYHQDYYNNINDTAVNFLEEYDDYEGDEFNRSIEKLYKWWEWKGGYKYYKDTILDKLDLIYYFEARELMKKAIEEEELDLQYWED